MSLESLVAETELKERGLNRKEFSFVKKLQTRQAHGYSCFKQKRTRNKTEPSLAQKKNKRSYWCERKKESRLLPQGLRSSQVICFQRGVHRCLQCLLWCFHLQLKAGHELTHHFTPAPLSSELLPCPWHCLDAHRTSCCQGTGRQMGRLQHQGTFAFRNPPTTN